jgi:hypothetical protein
VGVTADEFELQHELQRFTTQFTDRITQATEVLERSPRPEARNEALRKNLPYVASAMVIASGQARLGAREILDDALVRLTEGPRAPVAKVKQLLGRGTVRRGLRPLQARMRTSDPVARSCGLLRVRGVRRPLGRGGARTTCRRPGS